MSQTCGICAHPQRETIERLMVGNTSCRKIGGQFDLSASTVSRHRHHIPESLLGSARAAKTKEENELVRACNKLLADVALLSRKVRHSGKRNTVEAGKLLLQLSRETREILLLRSRLSGPRVSTTQRPNFSPEPTEDDAAEITEAEADEIAKKWLARRGSTLDHNANVPLKSLAAQGVSAHCPDKSANEGGLEDAV